MRKTKISLIGLGKLGLPLSQCLANCGFSVIGLDININLLKSLKIGKVPFFEPGLQDLLTKNSQTFTATDSYSQIVRETDFTIILVATPTDQEGNFSNKYIYSAIESLSNELKLSSKPYHQIVVSSTVMPGSMREKIIPLLEKKSGRIVGKAVGISYVPDFVAIGNIIHDFQNPDFLLIGADDKESTRITREIYTKMIKAKTPVSEMSIPSAEITKVALNNYLTTKISFANMLSNVCELIPNCNVDQVTETLALDRRINGKYLKGGTAFGGTCFPRDTVALRSLIEKHGLQTDFVDGVNKTNEYQYKHLSNKILLNLKKNGATKITILGLAFKSNTGVVEESTGINLIQKLSNKKNITLYGYDPHVTNKNLPDNINKRISLNRELSSAVKDSDIVVIVNFDNSYSNLPKLITKKNVTIIDCWRMFKANNFPISTKYIGLGINEK